MPPYSGGKGVREIFIIIPWRKRKAFARRMCGAACIAGPAISVTTPKCFAAQSDAHSARRAPRAISALLYCKRKADGFAAVRGGKPASPVPVAV